MLVVSGSASDRYSREEARRSQGAGADARGAYPVSSPRGPHNEVPFSRSESVEGGC